MLTALAAGSSIALNFGHPYLILDPPPRLLVACVYGVPPVCAPFAWHLFLLRVAHRRHPQHPGQDDAGPPGVEQDGDQDWGQDTTVPTPAGLPAARESTGGAAVLPGTGQHGESARVLVQALLAHDGHDDRVSWQQVVERTGLSRSRPYALLREERARRSHSNGRPTPSSQPARRLTAQGAAASPSLIVHLQGGA